MSHFAKVQDSIVTDVIVAEQDFIDTLDGTWIQCSYNTHRNAHKLGGTPLRGNYPSIDLRMTVRTMFFIHRNLIQAGHQIQIYGIGYHQLQNLNTNQMVGLGMKQQLVG